MEDQLGKELRFHLDQHERALIARGHSPAEARREARLALGGSEQVSERCRDARGSRWAEELLQDTSYALRTFRQKPGFVAITLLILGLGIGATTVMFAVINSVLLRPLPFPQPDRIVALHGLAKDSRFPNSAISRAKSDRSGSPAGPTRAGPSAPPANPSTWRLGGSRPSSWTFCKSSPRAGAVFGLTKIVLAVRPWP
jgi:hypothetical protein